MGKFLIWIAVAAVAWLAWKFYQASQRRIDQSQQRDQARRATTSQGERGQPAGASPERMVACARCGVHLPASEALEDAAGRPFCGPAHLEAAKRPPQ